jgi:hypothetical protein
MNGPARLVICGVLVLFAPRGVGAQGTFQSAPPTVTADAEPWYWDREPVLFAGNYYYPAGARIHFISTEMVRSGTYEEVPLYTRTTIEPYSVIYVPLAGGVMQPYERRRDGQLAGTVGSYAPSFPVATSRDAPLDGPGTLEMAQAPSPPMLESADLAAQATPAPARGLRSANREELTRLATGLTSAPLAAPPPIVRRPDSPNGLFVEFDGERWFSSGQPVTFDPARFTRIGEVRGFPVYRARSARPSTIYVPISRDMDVVAPYSARK